MSDMVPAQFELHLGGANNVVLDCRRAGCHWWEFVERSPLTEIVALAREHVADKHSEKQQADSRVGLSLTSSDPEPPMGTLVVDDCGSDWVNDGHRPCCWVRPDLAEQGIHDPETWTKIAGNYGPVTVLRWGQ